MNESELKQALDELKIDRYKYAFVYNLSTGVSVTDALKLSNRSKGWFYDGMPKEEQKRLIEIATELSVAPTIKAKEIIEGALSEAAEVKVSGLQSRNERIRQDTAAELLDRGLGKSTSNVDVTVKQNTPFEIRWSDSEDTGL